MNPNHILRMASECGVRVERVEAAPVPGDAEARFYRTAPARFTMQFVPKGGAAHDALRLSAPDAPSAANFARRLFDEGLLEGVSERNRHRIELAAGGGSPEELAKAVAREFPDCKAYRDGAAVVMEGLALVDGVGRGPLCRLLSRLNSTQDAWTYFRPLDNGFAVCVPVMAKCREALDRAARDGDAVAMESFRKDDGVSPSWADRPWGSPLYLAALAGNGSVIGRLLELARPGDILDAYKAAARRGDGSADLFRAAGILEKARNGGSATLWP